MLRFLKKLILVCSWGFIEIESNDESALTYGDLKLISNNRMLTDTIVNAAQNIIILQHPSMAGLPDTLLGQSFHSKDSKDQQNFCFKELPDQHFVQVLMMAIYIG